MNQKFVLRLTGTPTTIFIVPKPTTFVWSNDISSLSSQKYSFHWDREVWIKVSVKKTMQKESLLKYALCSTFISLEIQRHGLDHGVLQLVHETASHGLAGWVFFGWVVWFWFFLCVLFVYLLHNL